METLLVDRASIMHAAEARGRLRTSQLTALDHARLLHPPGSKGLAVKAWRERLGAVWDGEEGEATWREVLIDPAALDDRETLRQAKFISMQRYRRRRQEEASGPVRKTEQRLAELGSAYIDLDYYTTKALKHLTRDEACQFALRRLEDLGLPRPSLILSTGNGLCLVWLHSPVSVRAMPRWKAVQRELNKAFRGMGTDASSLTPTRVFRLAGTRNGQRVVSVLWPEYQDQIVRWSFEDLAHETLPLTREELKEKKVDRKRARAERARRPGGARLTVKTYWEMALRDLQRLKLHRYGEGPVDAGQRDLFTFFMAVAMSWTRPTSSLADCAGELAAFVGWKPQQAKGAATTVLSRARKAESGGVVMWKGKQRDTRYRVKARTVVEWLDITKKEAREANLRLLIPTAMRRERGRERAEKLRRSRGAKPRAEVQAARLADGQRALELRAQGMSVPQMAEQLSRSKAYVAKALAEAKLVGKATSSRIACGS